MMGEGATASQPDLAQSIAFAMDNPKQFKERLAALTAAKDAADKALADLASAQADAAQKLKDAEAKLVSASSIGNQATADLAQVQADRVTLENERISFMSHRNEMLAKIDADSTALAARQKALEKLQDELAAREEAAKAMEKAAAKALKEGEGLRDSHAAKIAALRELVK